MTEFKFFVRRMPGLNEIIKAAKAHPKQYSSMKKKWTDIVVGNILVAKSLWKYRGRGLPKFDRVIIDYEWIEPNNRRDPGNVIVGSKFIEDGIEKAGIIPRDSRKHIKGIIHSFGDNDKDAPGVRVTIKEY